MRVNEFNYRGYKVRTAVFGDLVSGFEAKAHITPGNGAASVFIPLYLERLLPREEDAEATIRTLAEGFIDETLTLKPEEETA